MTRRELHRQGIAGVCVVRGGFFALHEAARKAKEMEVFSDHVSETCEGEKGGNFVM